MKLIDYIKEEKPGLGNRAIKRALERGGCLVNGKIERFGSRKVNPRKDKITLLDVDTESNERLEISADGILFEDNDLLIYNKPPGHPSLATIGHKRADLHTELKKFYEEREGKRRVLEPAHRLDKDTSGVMVFAKSKDTLSKLFEMFKNKEIKKEYEAIIDGGPHGRFGSIKSYLNLKKQGKGWQKWESLRNSLEINKHNNLEISDLEEYFEEKPPKNSAKLAVTDYQVIKKYREKNYSHIKLFPGTGRTHQLRVHMLDLGHPIIGDSFYAEKFKSTIPSSRHLLHASSIKLLHPATGEVLKVFAPLPEDMQKFL